MARTCGPWEHPASSKSTYSLAGSIWQYRSDGRAAAEWLLLFILNPWTGTEEGAGGVIHCTSSELTDKGLVGCETAIEGENSKAREVLSILLRWLRLWVTLAELTWLLTLQQVLLF